MPDDKGSAPQIIPAWPTPLLMERRQDLLPLNQELEELVHSKANYRADKMLSQVGGWRTEPDLLKSGNSAIGRLVGAIYDLCERMHDAMYAGMEAPPLPDLCCEAWGNIYYANDLQIPHIHHDSIWSGVYFIATTEISNEINTNGAGCTNFFDPRSASSTHSKSPDNTFSIHPVPGLIILFPSWLRHSVTPHGSGDRRISIAFNIGLDRFK